MKVIVSGDDFGLAPAINEGILLAHRQGCLTSASICVAGPAAAEAAAAAADLPGLGIGLHLTLVAERPVSPGQAIESLLERNGRLPASALTFAARWQAGRIRVEHVRAEVRAQFERARELGLELTHVDGHQHLHVLPGVCEIVIEEMQRAGLTRLRIPLETETLSPAGWFRRLQRWQLNRHARRAVTLVRAAGFSHPDRFLGFFGAGHIDTDNLLARIAALQPGVTELALHPAAGSGLPRPDLASWGYRWDRELAALIDPRVAAALEQREANLIHFGLLEQR